jgi:hypothetical protein
MLKDCAKLVSFIIASLVYALSQFLDENIHLHYAISSDGELVRNAQGLCETSVISAPSRISDQFAVTRNSIMQMNIFVIITTLDRPHL